MSKFIVAKLVNFNINVIIAKTSPQTTGAGIQYLDKKFTFVLKNFPK